MTKHYNITLKRFLEISNFTEKKIVTFAIEMCSSIKDFMTKSWEFLSKS